MTAAFLCGLQGGLAAGDRTQKVGGIGEQAIRGKRLKQ